MRSLLWLLASWPFPGSLETSSESPHSNLGFGKFFVCLLLCLYLSFYSNSFRVLCLPFMDFDSLLLYFVCQVRDKDLMSFSYVRYPVLPALLVKADAFLSMCSIDIFVKYQAIWLLKFMYWSSILLHWYKPSCCFCYHGSLIKLGIRYSDTSSISLLVDKDHLSFSELTNDRGLGGVGRNFFQETSKMVERRKLDKCP